MDNEELQKSLNEYNEQLALVKEGLRICTDENEKNSLLSLQNDLNELINLTETSLETVISQNKSTEIHKNEDAGAKNNIDEEYSLFMEEMAKTGAYNQDSGEHGGSSKTRDNSEENYSDDSDIENELATLLGMKCSVYHTHKWGGEPTLHNAMVGAVIPRQDNDNFKDLQVRVLFTHPTHSEMIPCPFYLNGECKFSDELCRYSHGTIVPLSNLKEAIEPDFDGIKVGSRVLIKLQTSNSEDISLKKKTSEKYYLWHRAVIRSLNLDKRTCLAKLEHGIKSGEKRRSDADELHVTFENLFPLNSELVTESDTDESISDTEYPETKTIKSSTDEAINSLLVEKSLQQSGPAIGEWERHTRGIGSKLMFAMGYVPGTGLGPSSDGRIQPVEAKVLPLGKSLDHCMAISGKNNSQDPLKIEQKLKRMQKKEEERQRRAYERAIEKERRNVFNFLNKTIGDQPKDTNIINDTTPSTIIKQSSSKDLNIEQFKITEEIRRMERDITQLKSSLSRHSEGTPGYRNLKTQTTDKQKELVILKMKEENISKEQKQRKDKQKMTVF